MNLQSIIKKVLNEETNLSFKIRRRTNLIDNEVEKLLRSVYTPNVICRNYTGGIGLTAVISLAVIENLYFNTFYEMDVESKEWEETAQFIWDYIYENFRKTINDYYQSNC